MTSGAEENLYLELGNKNSEWYSQHTSKLRLARESHVGVFPLLHIHASRGSQSQVFVFWQQPCHFIRINARVGKTDCTSLFTPPLSFNLL